MYSYDELPSSPDEVPEVESGKRRAIDVSSARYFKGEGYDNLFLWTCIATLLSTALCCILFAMDVSTGFYKSPRDLSRRPLRRPSTYINLDRVLSNSTTSFPPLINFAQSVYQIRTSDFHRTMSEDDRSKFTPVGKIYPNSRHISITPAASTIIQFRHLDYRMERCSLMRNLPTRTKRFDPAISAEPISVIDLWSLDTTTEISRHIGDSWKYAPKRLRVLTSFSFNDSLTYDFDCLSNQFSTFELACSPLSSSICHIDFWQDHQLAPSGGIHILQRQT
ncbi:hypothetical protein CPB83DRAFT_861715 [Crepidotus variabilis]|uniref:Ubiquitin 3 binding protein But2 C-terminal domain-containing protein n=1 Tax=Crepidotus variabilis TaxID=179855 RepID=A0A9P6JKF2_9AGAR|nr:hypothetical protein CPB83DRAFT_861715 [Crepidotus variabilis]